jgi:predicted ATPase
MSGKSNILDVFRFLQDLVAPSQNSLGGLNKALNPRNGFKNVAWRGEENPMMEFTVEGDTVLNGRSMAWIYEISLLGNFQWGSAQVHQESLIVRDGEEQHFLIKTENQQRNSYAFDGKIMSQVSDTNNVSLEYEYPNWQGNFLRRLILSWRFYSLLPPLMRTPNTTAAANLLETHGENLSAWLMQLQTRYSESFERLRSAAKDVFPSLDSIFTTPTHQTTVYLDSREKFLKRSVTVGEMSDGELAFLALLSLLYAPEELGGKAYFVEEPENHLHPKLMTTIVDLLRQVQLEMPNEMQRQFVITTHSPYLIDKFSIDELVVLNRREGATSLLRPGDQKQLRELLSNEEIGLGDLYYSGALSLA